MRQQRIEAEKERLRREQERVKQAELKRQKEKEPAKAKSQLSNWAGQLNQKEIMAQLLRQHELQKAKSSSTNGGANMNAFGGNSTQNMAQQVILLNSPCNSFSKMPFKKLFKSDLKTLI